MSRIILLIIGFLGGCALGGGLAYGLFEVLYPPPAEKQLGKQDDEPAAPKPGPAKQLGKLSERESRRLDWLLGGSVIGGLIGLGIAHLMARVDSGPERPPANFKIGDPPASLQ